jgi:GntR family galactonate operon transcriptional repressor
MIGDDQQAVGSRRSLLHEQVMRLMARRIIRAVDGERPVSFTEAGLCREFEVSRTVVREAIKILAAKGLVDVRPKRGILANPKSKWHLTDPHVLSWLSETKPNHQFIRELCELRGALEPAAAELAALRATDSEAEEIVHCYERMEKATQHSRRFIDADLCFHAAILRACHNDLMEELTSKLRRAFRASIAVTFKVPGGLDPAMRMHRDVAEAISQHDPVRARTSMDNLLRKTAADVNDLLQIEDKSSQPEDPEARGIGEFTQEK